MTDQDIMKKANGGGLTRGKSSEGGRPSSASLNGGKMPHSGAPNLQNEWIPTEAVRAISKIKEQFAAQMTETCVS